MIKMTKRVPWVALIALLLVFAGCKGESPTAPPPGGSTPPGGTPPPSGVTLTLTSSNSDPLVDSTVVITANVSLNGAAVPNGTAVEFSTTNGTFTDTSTSTSIRTTTNGVATATLTSSAAGLARITAVVNNVSRTIDVTFRSRPVTTPPPSSTPTITAITPSVGRPAGGETIRITGANLRGPVRVLFDVGGATPVEGFVVSRTDSQIEVLTPAVNLGAGQQLASKVIVITEAGSTNEQRVEVANGFTFRNEQLTPRISTASPSSGPIGGGTRVTIFGDGFQAPVQVKFGFAEARVIEVNYSQIIVEAPAARDTANNGSGTVTGPVAITVTNINSQTTTSLTDGFRYVNKMQITAVRPLAGSSLGETDVTIDGTGFDGPVDVQIAGVQARVISVSGTRIVARTRPLPVSCSSASGGIFVTNISNGDFDQYGDAPNEGTFTYNGATPSITSVTGTLTPGGAISVTVRNPGIGPLGEGSPRFTIGDRTIIPAPSITTDPIGPTTFSFAIPTTGFTFPSVACTTGGGFPGTQLGPTDATLTYENAVAGCSDAVTVQIQPPAPNTCVSAPRPTVTTPAGGTCALPDPASVTGVGFPFTTTAPITISNAPDSAPLNITAVTITGANATEFSISPTTASNIAAGGSANFTLTFDPTTAGAKNATVTFTTNSTLTPTLTVCVQATAAP